MDIKTERCPYVCAYTDSGDKGVELLGSKGTERNRAGGNCVAEKSGKTVMRTSYGIIAIFY